MAGGVTYEVTLAGIRNPRYIVTGSDGLDKFEVKTYDSDGYDDLINLIDSGSGGKVVVDEISPIETFNAEPFNTTNGVSTKYIFSWFTGILTKDSDKIHFTLPKELEVVEGFSCSGLNGVVTVTCTVDPQDPKKVIAILDKVDQGTGLFKMAFENIRNPPSLRASSSFSGIKHTTSNEE